MFIKKSKEKCNNIIFKIKSFIYSIQPSYSIAFHYVLRSRYFYTKSFLLILSFLIFSDFFFNWVLNLWGLVWLLLDIVKYLLNEGEYLWESSTPFKKAVTKLSPDELFILKIQIRGLLKKFKIRLTRFLLYFTWFIIIGIIIISLYYFELIGI